VSWLSYKWFIAFTVLALVITTGFEWSATYQVHNEISEARKSTWRRLVTTLIDVVYMPGARRKALSDHGTRLILVGGTWLGLVIGGLAPVLLPELDVSNVLIWRIIGSVVLLAGAALRITSVRRLGLAAHRIIRADSTVVLVTTGPYRVMRHPAYAASLLIYLGIGLELGNVVSIAACLVLPFASRLPRIYIEEEVLRSVYGRQYIDYSARVRRMIPGVW
jgi:protein-S-isoprenylcysteine O-methyltransferase Ste14